MRRKLGTTYDVLLCKELWILTILIRFVEETDVVDRDPVVGVLHHVSSTEHDLKISFSYLLDVVHQFVGIRLTPVSSGAVGACDTTEEASVVLVAVVLHVVCGSISYEVKWSLRCDTHNQQTRHPEKKVS